MIVATTVAPEATVEPPKMKHAACVDTVEDCWQNPTCVVPTFTGLLTRFVKSVPAGNAMVNPLPLSPAKPPVADVTNCTLYEVCAPAALLGDTVTDTLPTWLTAEEDTLSV